MKEGVKKKRIEAGTEGTEAWKKVNINRSHQISQSPPNKNQKINREIAEFNAKHKANGNIDNKGFKRKRTVEQIYKVEDPAPVDKDFDITDERYATQIALPLLYPFYEKMQARNPNRAVYLIEDNASSHQKAARLLAEERERRGILKID